MQSLATKHARVRPRSSAPSSAAITTRRRRPVKIPPVVVAAAGAAAAEAAATAPPPQVALTHALASDGTPLELIYQPPAQPSSSSSSARRPAVLLVHGSYHAAWCWRDTFMPYLSARGWPVYALSMRAQGASGRQAAPGVARGVAGTLATHADDLASVVGAVARGVGEEETQEQGGKESRSSRPPPVVCAHSFGGLILQELISRRRTGAEATASAPPPIPLSGLAFLGSVPPSGNKDMVGRFLKRDAWASAKLTYAFVAASFAKDAKACRECFLSADAPDALAESVRARIAAQLSPLRLIDLADMSRRVPLPAPSAAAARRAPALVLRGAQDGVVDAEAAEELARWCASSGEGVGEATRTTRVEVEGLAHDVMLDVRWEEAARELAAWLEAL